MSSRPWPDERSAKAPEHRPVILVADGDRVSERAIERALARCHYDVEWARDGEAALDILRRTRSDIVIAEAVLSDMPGMTLMRRAGELCGPGAPPFLFVSAERAVATRISLLAAGAADFVAKPFAADELCARVVNAIELRRPAPASATRGISGLAGDCACVAIPDLLTVLELGGKSGSIEIAVGPAVGRLVVDVGRVIHAEFGAMSGEEAFFALLRASGGRFRFEPGEADAPRTLDARVSELLLESAVREDTDRHWIDDAARRRAAAGAREPGAVAPPVELGTAREPPRSLVVAARRLGVAIADPFALGDLALVAPELGPGPGQEIRIELWAAAADGVMALLALASPPGYQFVTSALRGEAARLQLRFETGGVALVVTLVDTEGAAELPTAAPAGIIVAPPGGELLALPPRRLADLTRRVYGDDSLVVVAHGGPAVHALIAQLAGDRARVQVLGAPLDADPRDAIGRVIQLWMTQHDHG